MTGSLIPELGHYALCLALALALAQCLLPAASGVFRFAALGTVARSAAVGQSLFIALAFAALTACFVLNDFSVSYIAANSNTQLPLAYRIAAVWGAHEGSLLLWVLMLCAWTVAVAWYSRNLPQDVAATLLAVLGAVSAGFILFMLATSNPFDRLFPAAAEGRDLNPLLQDPGLVIHPPMLYMGYVGFSVAFAFALSALIGGKLDSAWARWARPWTTAAWMFLTVGILLGSWWAYHELGWGGWWFWDPVENASFMPWLVGTALIHSLAVTEKRDALKSWTVLLAITAFAMSLLGTFLVRSGVLVSVHAFAVDPARGVFILIFFTIVVGGALLLYAVRAPKLAGGNSIALFSREGFLLLNNIFLITAAGAVFLGTLYPLLADALGWGKLSVGPPYFNTVFAPLTLPLVMLVGLVAAVRWKRASWAELRQRLGWPALVILPLGAALPWLAVGGNRVGVAAAVALACWVMISAWLEPARWWQKDKSWRANLIGIPRSAKGMALAHFGLGLFVLGVTLTSSFSSEQSVRLAPGESAPLAGFDFRLEGSRERQGPNYDAKTADFTVLRDGRELARLAPEKRFYRAQGNTMTEAGVLPRLHRDLYVALGEPLEQGAWSLRLYYRPFVRCIWLGALLMACGGLLALTDRRYRLAALVNRPEN
ncbi:MAG: heme lyase CcmF/NrfE family subunit [Nevskiales bacterium]